MSALKQILNRQRAWADSRGIELDPPDYTARLEDNLYSKLSERALEEYGGAAGQELVDSRGAKPAKMRALESSSALVLNVFEHLRLTNLKAIGAILNIAEPRLMGIRPRLCTPRPHLMGSRAQVGLPRERHVRELI